MRLVLGIAPIGVALWFAGFMLTRDEPGLLARLAIAMVVFLLSLLPLRMMGRKSGRDAMHQLNVAWESLDIDALRSAERALIEALPKNPSWWSRDKLIETIFWARVLMGEPERAIEAASARSRITQLRSDPDRFAMCAQQLAMGFALMGDISSAIEWSDSPALRGREPWAITSVLISLRGAEPEPLYDWFESNWPTLELHASPREARKLRLLWAFAAHRETRGDVAQLVAGCRPFAAGEYERWAVRWPEMITFLREHQLV
jgi:hypothetical protein